MATPPPGPAENFYQQLKTLRADFLGYLVNAAQTYGDVVRLQPGPNNYLYLLNHPDLTRRVLVTHADQYRKSAMTQKMVRRFLGNGLILNEGEPHKQQRKLIQPAFHKQRVEAYAEPMVKLTLHEMENWRPDEPFDFEKSMIHLTMHIVAHTLFGTEVIGGPETVGQIMEVFADAISGQFRALPLPEWMPIPRHLRQRAAVAQMDALIKEMVWEWEKTGEDKGDLMSMLLLAHDDQTGTGMGGQQLRDELVSTYFAGHKTVAKLISWVVYLLTQHPQVAHGVQVEILDRLDGRSPTPADLPQLVYLDQVIKETLRLYPSAWVFDREPIEDVDLMGYRIPAGGNIYLSPYVSHRDKRFFERPNAFLPERFAAGWEQRIPKYVYFPFGAGPRVCIGQAFAEMESKLILATILSKFEFKLATSDPILPEPGATLRPKHGLQVYANRINSLLF